MLISEKCDRFRGNKEAESLGRVTIEKQLCLSPPVCVPRGMPRGSWARGGEAQKCPSDLCFLRGKIRAHGAATFQHLLSQCLSLFRDDTTARDVTQKRCGNLSFNVSFPITVNEGQCQGSISINMTATPHIPEVTFYVIEH